MSGTLGRPRDASRDVAILEATLALLIGNGYEQLSIEAVAARSGAAKTTIYRRYRDKAALVAAAVEHRSPATPPSLPGDDLRADLLVLVTWLARQIAEQEIGLLGAMFAGMRGDPGLAAEMRRILHRDAAAMTDRLPGEASGGVFAEVAPALIVHRVVVVGEPCDERFVEHLVDDILLPLLRGGRSG
ncbi:MAG TPA: TetR/AcrR family transcriptional regulator [Amycolatopsis sp.]